MHIILGILNLLKVRLSEGKKPSELRSWAFSIYLVAFPNLFSWYFLDVANAQLSNEVTVKTVDLPIPEALSALPNLNMTYHDIRWSEPKNLPKYLQNDPYKKNKLSYR